MNTFEICSPHSNICQISQQQHSSQIKSIAHIVVLFHIGFMVYVFPRITFVLLAHETISCFIYLVSSIICRNKCCLLMRWLVLKESSIIYAQCIIKRFVEGKSLMRLRIVWPHTYMYTVSLIQVLAYIFSRSKGASIFAILNK